MKGKRILNVSDPWRHFSTLPGVSVLGVPVLCGDPTPVSVAAVSQNVASMRSVLGNTTVGTLWIPRNSKKGNKGPYGCQKGSNRDPTVGIPRDSTP